MSTWSTAFPQTSQVITANAQTIGPFDITPFSNVIVVTAGTHSGVTLAFEVSVDGSTWVGVGGSKLDNTAVVNGSSALSTNATTGFDFAVGAATSFRVRSTAYTSGTVNVGISFGNAAYEPSVTTSAVSTGSSASGSADDGSNPVKIAGIAFTNGNGQIVTNGQRAAIATDLNGAPYVVLKGGSSSNTPAVFGSATDAVATGNTSLAISAFNNVYNGSTWDRQRTPTTFKPLASTAIGTEATVWTPGAGKKFRLMGFVITASAAVDITLKDNTAGTTIFRIPTLIAGTPLVVILEGNGILSAAANNVLTATSSAAANVIGTWIGMEE